jgi:hypothetical protein
MSQKVFEWRVDRYNNGIHLTQKSFDEWNLMKTRPCNGTKRKVHKCKAGRAMHGTCSVGC